MSQELSEQAKHILQSIKSMRDRLSSFISNVDVVDLSLAKRSRFNPIFSKILECKKMYKGQRQECVNNQLNSMCKQQYQRVDLTKPPTIDTLLYVYCIKQKINEARMATLVDL